MGVANEWGPPRWLGQGLAAAMELRWASAMANSLGRLWVAASVGASVILTAKR